jgi:nucleoside-triphosphatase
MSPPIKLLLTGDPGCGKTTVLTRLVDRLRDRIPLTGTLTIEIREAGQRRGFGGVTTDGGEFLLAHRDTGGDLRVGPYGVDLRGLETVGLPALEPREDTKLIVLDEIGKMELLSSKFRDRVEALLDGPIPLLATVASTGVGYVRRVRNDPRVTLLKMRRHQSDSMVGDILRTLKDAGVIPSTR